ncbi:MAG: toll/interleukin-1 receptor domain-containing protein [Flavobacteriaceae bacterium]
MKIPKVFISYSHDSLEHKKWVLELAIRMRNNGIDALIDQWELQPGDDLPHFMETQLANSDSVLMICSDKYVKKANEGTGGVGYEKMIITSNLLSNIDSNKIIPIIRQSGTHIVPTFLKTKIYIDFSIDDHYEFSFDELLRTIHNSPLLKKPEIGNNPFKDNINTPELKAHDGVLNLMKVVVKYFESSSMDYVGYDLIRKEINISRIMLDMLISEAISLGYLFQSSQTKSIYLKEKGKIYALNNKLV